MEKYKDSDVELMSILLKLQEQTSPIRMSIGYTVGGTVRQGIILYEAAPKVIETLIEKGYTCDLNGCGMRVWKEREKLKSFTEEFPDKKEDEQKPEVPWYVNTDVDWYIENYKERYYKAVELGNVVRKFLQYDEGDRTKYAEEFAQKYLGKGQRTLYRYTKAYLEASAWADKLEKEDGAGREFFKVLCLCRKPKETGCFPSIKPEVKQVIKNIWFNEDFARNQGTREMLYEKLTAIANINKWEKIPSYQTVTRYISYLMEDGVEHTREFRVIWHEEHNLIFLDGTWSLDGSKIIDAWQKTEVL